MLSAYMEIFNMQSQNCSDRSKNNDASLYSTEDLNPGSLIYDQEENHSGNTILYRYLNIWQGSLLSRYNYKSAALYNNASDFYGEECEILELAVSRTL